MDITGDPEDAQCTLTVAMAMKAIEECLRLGLERNNEANVLRLRCADLEKKLVNCQQGSVFTPDGDLNAAPARVVDIASGTV